ncbi:MAG: T9SS type A sorting domain-containing protein [Candidatus Neomarinimicrobiota bacterium]
MASTIRVPQDQLTIQEGIDSSIDGDTVLVDTGRYVENINFNGKNIVVASLLLVTGDTSHISQTVIDGSNGASTVTFESGEDSSAVLRGFHITNGKGAEVNNQYYGGGISVINSSGPRLVSLLISDNATDYIGGGILCEDAAPKLTDVTLSRNVAYYDGGGIYCSNSVVSLGDVEVRHNTADLGGGIYCDNSELSLSNATFWGNSASAGGGIYFLSSNSTLENVKLRDNSAERGGGIFWVDSNPVFDSLHRCNIYSNHANVGSDLYAYEPPVIPVVVDTFTVMNPTSYHAFFRNNFTFDILHAKIEQVESDLYVSPDGDDTHNGLSPSSPLKTLSYALSIILAEDRHPHTIFLDQGTYSPSTTGEAFPLSVPGFVSLSGESTDDVVLDAEGESGVINLGQAEGVRLENLTVTGGSAVVGGGIYSSSSSPELVNVTVSGNVAHYLGGGIYCTDSSPILVNVTMSGNVADYGGGIYCTNNSSPVIANSILWDDFPEEINFFAFGAENDVAIFYSDLQGGENGIVTNENGSANWVSGNIMADPLFADPDGGDFHLQETSPCIDAGTAFLVLEGDTLVLLPDTAYEGSAPDMGAFESPQHPVGAVTEGTLPAEFALYQNYPNPFNAITTIELSVPKKRRVVLTVYDLLGREVKTILNRPMEAGQHELRWNASEVQSGIYLVRMQAGDFIRTRKVTLLR